MPFIVIAISLFALFFQVAWVLPITGIGCMILGIWMVWDHEKIDLGMLLCMMGFFLALIGIDFQFSIS